MVASFLIFQKMRVFCKKIERFQHNAALTITGAVQGIYRKKSRSWLKKLYCFYKTKGNGIPSYLAELIPSESHLYNIRNTRNIRTYFRRSETFNYSFFPWTINECNKLNFNIRTSNFSIFRVNSKKIIQPISNSIFDIFNPLGL